MKIWLKILVLTFTFSGLTSCVIPLPHQMSRHVYTSPASPDGKLCFNQCMSKRALCISTVKKILDTKGKYNRCVITELNKSGNRFIESPVNNAYWSGSKIPENCTMYWAEESCGQYNESATRYDSDASCDNNFNSCVSLCGGSFKVETKTICWGGVE